MGLFYTIQPQEDFRDGGIAFAEPPAPWIFRLRYGRNVILQDLFRLFNVQNKQIDELELTRHWLHCACERVERRFSNTVAVLFKPKGRSNYGISKLFRDRTPPDHSRFARNWWGFEGTSSGCLCFSWFTPYFIEFIAGFASLIVAYFDYPGLCKSLSDVDLDSFKVTADS